MFLGSRDDRRVSLAPSPLPSSRLSRQCGILNISQSQPSQGQHRSTKTHFLKHVDITTSVPELMSLLYVTCNSSHRTKCTVIGNDDLSHQSKSWALPQSLMHLVLLILLSVTLSQFLLYRCYNRHPISVCMLTLISSQWHYYQHNDCHNHYDSYPIKNGVFCDVLLCGSKNRRFRGT
jgi:hypothetical protein